MSGERLYPVLFLRIKREGKPLAVRVVDDATVPAEGEEVIRAKVTSLVFEDDEKKADVLKLTIDNFDLSYWDDPWVKPGDLIKAKWGYPGNMSGQVECVVTKIKASGTILTIESNGKEYELNRVVRPRVWPPSGMGVKRSDVVRAIAEEYGYGANAEIHDTEVVLPRIIQAKLTDHQLLVEMAKREGWVFYIDANGFYFGPRKLGQTPLKTLTYYTDGTGTILSFPSVDGDLFARPGAVTAHGRDPDTKKDFKVTANNDTTKGRSTVASTVEVVEPVNRKTGETSYGTKPAGAVATATTVATTAKNEADAKRHVAGIYQQAQLGAVKLTVPVVGDPLLRAKSIVELSGIGKQLVGKYYLTAVTHTLNGNGYTCSLKARREAPNSAAAVTQPASKGAANKQAAPAPGSSAEKGDKLTPRVVVDPRDGTTKVQYR